MGETVVASSGRGKGASEGGELCALAGKTLQKLTIEGRPGRRRRIAHQEG